LCSNIERASEVRLEAVARCQRSEWTVKEALRLNAAAPVLWRRAVRDFDFGGSQFPRGTITGVNPMLTHLLPSIWDEPLRFNPARHAPEDARRRHRFAFTPFGGGAHGCLGANYAYLQVKVLLRCVLENHELTIPADHPPVWYHWPNCRPRGKLELGLQRRLNR
jgi:cytochrome P450